MGSRRWMLAAWAAAAAGWLLSRRERRDPFAVVPELDLERYQGEWHEIARLPAWFERECVEAVTAEYRPAGGGAVAVLNRCRRRDGGVAEARGLARPRWPGERAARLRVRFFGPFAGDYWVLRLDPGYRWSLVGTPDRRYLWILARSPEMDAGRLAGLLDSAARLGFPVQRMKTSHPLRIPGAA